MTDPSELYRFRFEAQNIKKVPFQNQIRSLNKNDFCFICKLTIMVLFRDGIRRLRLRLRCYGVTVKEKRIFGMLIEFIPHMIAVLQEYDDILDVFADLDGKFVEFRHLAISLEVIIECVLGLHVIQRVVKLREQRRTYYDRVTN